MLPSDLPPNLSSEYREQLCALLPYAASNPLVANLMTAQRDADGKLQASSPVLNRPWEWIENIGDQLAVDPKEDQKEREERTRYLVRNSASLSLETFGARITGDGIIRNIMSSEEPRVDGDIRIFEDGLSVEGIFERDWRQSRLDVPDELMASGVGRAEGEGGNDLNASKRPSMPSPMTGVRSGPSTGPHSAAPSSPKEPAISEETVAVEGASKMASITGSHKGTKRKVEVDDVEVLEGPPEDAPVQTIKKKVKARTSARTRKI